MSFSLLGGKKKREKKIPTYLPYFFLARYANITFFLCLIVILILKNSKIS